MPDYDVAIIGAGPGGYVAAIRAAQLGLRAALIERDSVGGLCLNWGCIPSKALLYSAELLDLLRRGDEFGIHSGEITADYATAVRRSRQVVAGMVGGVETLLKQNGVALLHGTASIEGPGRVRVAPAGEAVEASHIVVATGAVPRLLPGLPVDGTSVIGSREALALESVPESIAIVGGGPVGVEFAYLFSAFGSRVTLLEALPHLLPGEDEDVCRQLERNCRARGIDVRTSTRVLGARPDGGVVLDVESAANGAAQVEAKRVLAGVGIRPNTEGLGLEAAGVALEGGFVGVDEYCRTNVEGIWAIGDVTGKLPLAHVASRQGITVVEAIAGREPPPLDYDAMPRAVYCQPQVASLGLTEEQARARGIEVRAGRFPLRASGKAMALGQTEGFVKLVVDGRSGALAGFHAIGHNVTEMLAEAAVAMLLESTPAELAAAVHAHPTLSEALREAALAVSGEAIHFYAPRAGRQVSGAAKA